MLLSLAEHVIELHTWEEKGDLLNHVMKCDGGMLILGENASQEIEFYSTVVHYNYAARRPDVQQVQSWGVALISEGHGLKPHLLMLPNKVLVFGFNQEAVGISVSERREVFRLSFDSLFRSFLYLPDQKLLLVLNEIGVVSVTENGKENWRYEKDVITDCLIERGKLLMKFMDSPPVTIDLSTGSVT